jgi:hypothetical protein
VRLHQAAQALQLRARTLKLKVIPEDVDPLILPRLEQLIGDEILLLLCVSPSCIDEDKVDFVVTKAIPFLLLIHWHVARRGIGLKRLEQPVVAVRKGGLSEGDEKVVPLDQCLSIHVRQRLPRGVVVK